MNGNLSDSQNGDLTMAEDSKFDYEAALAAVDPSQPIKGAKPAGPNHHTVGTLTESMKRKLLVKMDLRERSLDLADEYLGLLQEHNALHIEHGMDADIGCEEFRRNLDRLGDQSIQADVQANTANSWFWNEVRSTFPELEGKDRVGVCENDQVVWEETPEIPSGRGVLVINILHNVDTTGTKH